MNSREHQAYQEALLRQQLQQQQEINRFLMQERLNHQMNQQVIAAAQMSANRTMQTANMMSQQRQQIYNQNINAIDRRTTRTWDRIYDNVNDTITYRNNW
jgi:hypothetical protein